MIINKRTSIIFLACAAIIVCAIFARSAHQTMNATEKERARLVAQVAALTTRLHAAKSDLAQAKDDWNGEQAATTGSDKTAIEARNNAIFNAAQKRMNQSNDPKFQKARDNMIQASVIYASSPLLAFLDKEHLAPDQTARLRKALIQRTIDKSDVGLALKSQGLATGDPSGIELMQQVDDTFQQTVEDIAGPDAYARIATYDRQNSIWSLMGGYGAVATSIGLPVPSAQMAQMVDYITQNNPDYKEGKFVNMDQIDWPAVNDYARTIMTPEQFDLFTHLTAKDVVDQKLTRALDAISETNKKQDKEGPAN